MGRSLAPVLDSEGKPLLSEDCVEHENDIYAVMGLMAVAGEDVVVLGDVMGGDLVYPFLVPASDCFKVEI